MSRMDQEEAVNILVNALVWRRKLDEHADLMQYSNLYDPSSRCPGCSRYVAAMLRGASPVHGIEVACDTIKAAHKALAAARQVALDWDGSKI